MSTVRDVVLIPRGRTRGPSLLEDITRIIPSEVNNDNRALLDITNLTYSNGMVNGKLLIDGSLLSPNNIVRGRRLHTFDVNFDQSGMLLPNVVLYSGRFRVSSEARVSIMSRMGPMADLEGVKYITRAYMKFFDISPSGALDFVAYSSGGSRGRPTMPSHLTYADLREELTFRVKTQFLDSSKTLNKALNVLRSTGIIIHRSIAPLDMTLESIAYKLSSFDITPRDSLYDLLSYVDWIASDNLDERSTIVDRMNEVGHVMNRLTIPVTLVVSVDDNVLYYLNRYIHGEYRELISELGLVVPPNVSDESYLREILYILSGLLVDRVEGSTAITSYSDEELIMTYLAAYPYYQSRRELISNLEFLRYNRGFFMPTTRRCKNTESYLGSSTSDESIQMISYGTIEDYVCYEVEELEMSFNNSDTYPFISPSREFNYTEDQVRRLKDLTTIYPSMRLLGRTIDRGYLQIERDNQLQGEQSILFNTLSIEDRDALRTIFRRTLESAMYMRRWTGKGPYPLKKQHTLDGSIDPIINATPSLNALLDSIGSLRGNAKKFMKRVELYRMVADELVTDGTLLRKIDSIYAGETCIRMASKPLIVTAVKFLSDLFGERHPDLDAGSIDNIT